MYPPDQHRRPSHSGRRSQRRSNVDHGSQPILHQYAGGHDFAFDDNVVGPCMLQPHNSRSFQQLATQFTSGGSYTNPPVFEGNRSHAWAEQQESMEQEQSCGNGDPASANYPDASHYHLNIPGATGGWHSRQGYSHGHGSASVSMTSSHSARQSVPSVAFNGSMNSPVQPPGYYHQADAIAGSQMIQDASVVSREDSYHSHIACPGQVDVGDGVNMELIHGNPEQPPWSPYYPASMNHSPYLLEEPTMPDWQNISEPTFSTTDHEGSDSGYIGDSCTPLSSMDYSGGSMLESTLTERPGTGYPQNTDPGHIPPDCTPSGTVPHIDIDIDIDKDYYMPPMEPQPTMESPFQYGANLVVPLSRTHSTRSSASDASSTGPPTFTPEVMYCDVGDCRQAFSGQYRRGNLGKSWP